MDPGQSAAKLEQYLQQLIRNGGLDLQYVFVSPDPPTTGDASTSAEPAPALEVHFSGPDVPLLTARNAELLHAIETIAADILKLEPAEHRLLQFDADNFRANRARSLEQAVEEACAGVRSSGRPHPFPPMNSRERRLVHLAAARLGVQTASLGEGPRRNVVLYPPGMTPGQQNISLPGERRSRPAFSGPGRSNGSQRSRANGDRTPRPARTPHPDAQPPMPASDEDNRNRVSEEDRIRAIRERFRKR